MRTPATDVLERLGCAYELRRYDEVEKTAEEAARKLSLPLQTVYKTLLVRSGREFAFAVVGACQQLSLRRLARVWGRPGVEMADPGDIGRITGYVRGSVSPLGARRALPVFIDEGASHLERVAVSAGARGAELVLSPLDLLEAANAKFCAIAQ